jgi:hypothetical protein
MLNIINNILKYTCYWSFEMIWWLWPWCISMKSWVQTLMNVCINVYNVYIHWCIMYKCNIQTCTYGGSEWCQNILLKNTRYIYIYIQGFFSITCHEKYNAWLHDPKKSFVWQHGTVVHVISTWDFIISLLETFN